MLIASEILMLTLILLVLVFLRVVGAGQDAGIPGRRPDAAER